MTADDAPPPSVRLQALLTSARLWYAVVAAAELGVADRLAHGARTAAQLAVELPADEDALYRLLRALAAGGILREGSERRFELTGTGDLLREDVPGSMRPWARYMGREYLMEAWGHLARSVEHGENAFAALHGEDIWTWRAHEPEERALFDASMAALTRGVSEAMADAYDFGGLGSVVDVGGGSGTLMAAILARHRAARGIVFDQPSVIEAAEARRIVEAAGVADRCTFAGGSFFESVPGEAGGYVLKAILHDWEDPEATRILRTIRASAAPSSKLLVFERVIGGPNEDLAGKISDLNMLVMPGGRERTEPEWRSLFESGGFRLDEIRRLTQQWCLLVGSVA